MSANLVKLQGEKECAFYIKTGQCKFGASCKFHHPQPAGTSVTSPAPSFYPTVQQVSVPSHHQYPTYVGWQVARPSVLPGSYMPVSYPRMLSPGIVPVQGWNPYAVCRSFSVWTNNYQVPVSYFMAFMLPRHQLIPPHHLLFSNQFKQDRYMDHQANYLPQNQLCMDLKYLRYHLLGLQALT